MEKSWLANVARHTTVESQNLQSMRRMVSFPFQRLQDIDSRPLQLDIHIVPLQPYHSLIDSQILRLSPHRRLAQHRLPNYRVSQIYLAWFGG